jgi:hypothetical protein
MISKFAFAALLVTLLTVPSPRAAAQTTPPPAGDAAAPPPAPPTGTPETLTGCIQRGDAETEYTLASADGGVWGLQSAKIKLAPHLNHTVTVSGTVAVPIKPKPRKEDVPAHENRRGILAVSKLKMVSTTCAQ